MGSFTARLCQGAQGGGPVIEDQYTWPASYIESAVYNAPRDGYNAGMTNGFRSYFYPRWVIVALLSMLGVLALTHIPQDALPRVFQHYWHDKLEHFVAYGLVGAPLMLSLRRPVRLPIFLAMLCVLAAIGALDEITQPLVHRHASILDFAADLVGIAAACLVLLVRRRPWLSAPAP